MNYSYLQKLADLRELRAEIVNAGTNVTIRRCLEAASEIEPSKRTEFWNLRAAWLEGLHCDLPAENAMYCIDQLFGKLAVEDRDTLMAVMFPEARE